MCSFTIDKRALISLYFCVLAQSTLFVIGNNGILPGFIVWFFVYYNILVKGKEKKERYIHLNAEFQRIERRDEKAFLSDEYKEIEENNKMGKTSDLFKKIRDAKGTFMQRWAQ